MPSVTSRPRPKPGNTVESRGADVPPGAEPRGIDRDIADADKAHRAGTPNEPVRHTPPAGPWNDTSAD